MYSYVLYRNGWLKMVLPELVKKKGVAKLSMTKLKGRVFSKHHYQKIKFTRPRRKV